MPLIMIGIIIAAGSVVLGYYREVGANDPRLAPKSIVASMLLGGGIMMLLSPALLYWFVHGSHDRYMWIISGPAPFSMLGGGPFQLWLMFLSVMIGFVLISCALAIYQSMS